MARRARPAAPTTGDGEPAARGSDASPADAIDALYQQPLGAFIVARNELAKSLIRSGARDQAARVKALAKPAVVPWAVNQVYWHARSIWDRLLDTGAAVRSAQVAALETPGTTPAHVQRARDTVRDATATHRKAVADAVHQAVRLAGQADVHPNADQLARMLEAVSLAASLTADPGRFTDVVQPAGFEALLGVTPVPDTDVPRPRPGTPATVTPLTRRATPAAEPAVDRTAERAAQARIAAAKDTLAAARAAAHAADAAERQANDALADAELRVTQAKADLRSAQAAARNARDAHTAAQRALAHLTGDA